jgi:hypothetical protein
MSESTPERLKAFRAEHRAENSLRRRITVLALVLFLLVLVNAAVLATFFLRDHPPAAGAASPEHFKEYALYLEEKRLPLEAIGAYQQYLDAAALSDAEQARLCYSVAKLAIEAEEFEKGLAYLYRAELLDPDSDLKSDIDRKITLCLDKLGRNVDLRRELRRRTVLSRSPEEVTPGEIVLAEFAGQVVTNHDLDVELEKLPAAARESFNDPEKRQELLKNLVAERLLLEKAFRLGFDEDEEIQERLSALRDQMIVRKLIDQEVQSRIQITPEDVERFYKAEVNRFTRPARAHVRVHQASSSGAEPPEDAFTGEAVLVTQGEAIPGVPYDAAALDAVFGAEPGKRVGPFEIEGRFYTFLVETVEAEAVLPFEKVKDEAQRMLSAQKEQELFQDLIDETVTAQDVQLYLDRIEEPAAS